MARSRKRTPIHGITAGAMSQFRRQTNKRLRAGAKAALATQDLEALTDPRVHEEVSDVYYGPQDGKMYDRTLDPRYMRK